MYELRINGRTHHADVASGTPLLWVLRDALGLTGTKYGCGMGLCGACTVLRDGAAVRSCQITVDSVGNAAITTIEGLSPDGSHPVQRAWVDADVPQCGYCQAGQILTAAALLAHGTPTDEEIERVMSGVLCRCGTYHRIRLAVRAAAGLPEE